MANDDKLFIVAVGGTGMRCLESFVYLCAMGMMDNKEIEVLTIDTDSNNGNKERSESVIGLYNEIRADGQNPPGRPNEKTFFSAKLNLFKYAPDYSQESRNTFAKISDTNNEARKAENKLLADLFLDPSTAQQFNLSHGYRAQTHLGSYLMYHSIIEAARKLSRDNQTKNLKDLGEFIDRLSTAGRNARVFIFGSIFGGTGASAIPILPKAFEKFTQILRDGRNAINLEQTKFGATLLTEYFEFDRPTDKQRATLDNSGIIADSSLFPLNSQAALQFYQNDPTVRKTYKILYQIGWPFKKSSLKKSEGIGDIITGGANQKNPAHIVELLAAGAAFDFFTRLSYSPKTQYLFNSVELSGQSPVFSFGDIVGNSFKDDFEMKAGAFFSLAHVILAKYEAAYRSDLKGGIFEIIERLKNNNIKEYKDIPTEELGKINSFFRGFGYSFDNKSETFQPGWFYQIQKSIMDSTEAGAYFLFPLESFPDKKNTLAKLDVGKINGNRERHWPTGNIFSNSTSEFIKTLTNLTLDENHSIGGSKEKLLYHLFTGLNKSQNY